MRFGLLVLSALPTAWAALAYTPPTVLRAQAADAASNCKLPDDYHIRDFHAESADAGKSLSGYEFTFSDDTTKVTTPCYFNSSSEATNPNSSGNPRYPCVDPKVNFIWQDEPKKLWMVQRVCPGPDGAADFEASGSVIIPVKCAQKCSTNSTDYRSLFTSIQPVRDSAAR